MTKVVVAGSLNMDVVVAVDVHPRVGETVAGQGLSYFPGGKGANQAIAARRLGAEVQMVGRVGNDAFGESLIALQRSEGIDTRHLHVVPDTPTGVALIAVAAAGANTIIVNPGANAAWHDGDLDAVTFARGDILLTQRETPPWLVEAVLRKAGAARALRILNPSPVAGFDTALLPLCDMLVLNEIELADIAGMPVTNEETALTEAAATLIQRGCKTVIVTLGADGALLCTNGEVARIATCPVTAIDSTGAGDCFTGALAAALLRGVSMKDAVSFANKAAAISVTRKGASPSMPTLTEIEAFAQ